MPACSHDIWLDEQPEGGSSHKERFAHHSGWYERALYESEPDDVAKQGIDTLFDGQDHVYSASFKTKLEGMVANLVPGRVKGAMHDKMARPIQ